MNNDLYISFCFLSLNDITYSLWLRSFDFLSTYASAFSLWLYF